MHGERVNHNMKKILFICLKLLMIKSIYNILIPIYGILIQNL